MEDFAEVQATLDTSGGIESTNTMDNTISDAWKDISKGLEAPQETIARDVTGKFARKDGEVAEVAATPAAPAEAVADVTAEPEVPAAPVVESKKAPSSWKREAADAFSELPPHVQDEVLRREGDIHKGIEGYRAQAERAKAFDQAFAPYMQTIQKMGVTPEVAASALFKADNTLRYAPPAVKLQEIQNLAKYYGIDLQAQIDPNTAELQSRLYQLEQEREQFKQEQQAQTSASLNSDITRFASEPGHEHFDAVRDHMASLLQGGQAKDLQEAYDQAVYANPQTRATVLAQQLEKTRAEAQRKANDAKKAASVNVATRGTVAAGAPARTPWNDADIKADAVRLGF